MGMFHIFGGSILLQGVKDMPRLANRIAAAVATPKDWLSLFKSLGSSYLVKDSMALMIKTALHRSTSANVFVPQLIHDLLSRFSAELDDLQLELDRVIDFPMSQQSGRVRIHPGVSDTLDKYLEALAGLPEYLADLQPELDACVPELNCLSLHYLPQSK
jgi:DNA mismatch repair ATPase MutS